MGARARGGDCARASRGLRRKGAKPFYSPRPFSFCARVGGEKGGGGPIRQKRTEVGEDRLTRGPVLSVAVHREEAGLCACCRCCWAEVQEGKRGRGLLAGLALGRGVWAGARGKERTGANLGWAAGNCWAKNEKKRKTKRKGSQIFSEKGIFEWGFETKV